MHPTPRGGNIGVRINPTHTELEEDAAALLFFGAGAHG
jgi:hypothetical protein